MKYFPYSHQTINKADINEVVSVLKSDFLTQGPVILDFEKKLAKEVGAKYAVTFNSGTAALHGAYFTLGLTKDDEFITSPMTFSATANAGLYLNAKPVFVDIEADTGNIDTSKIETEINTKTRLIVPIHFGGYPVNMKKIQQIANQYHLFVVEDACHALGTKYQNSKIGNCRYSDMTVFSFHPVKHITTGEGGAVATNNLKYYKKLLMFRTHGITKKNYLYEPDGDWYYEMQILGYNYRMTDIQAALGISQLKRLPAFIKRRREIANIYNQEFAKNPFFDLPVEEKGVFSAYHLYPIRLKDGYKKNKKKIFSELRENGLGVQVHYIPVYRLPYYQNLGFRKGLCPNAEDFYQREISIPIYPSMSNKNVKLVINIIFKVFNKIK